MARPRTRRDPVAGAGGVLWTHEEKQQLQNVGFASLFADPVGLGQGTLLRPTAISTLTQYAPSNERDYFNDYEAAYNYEPLVFRSIEAIVTVGFSKGFWKLEAVNPKDQPKADDVRRRWKLDLMFPIWARQAIKLGNSISIPFRDGGKIVDWRNPWPGFFTPIVDIDINSPTFTKVIRYEFSQGRQNPGDINPPRVDKIDSKDVLHLKLMQQSSESEWGTSLLRSNLSTIYDRITARQIINKLVENYAFPWVIYSHPNYDLLSETERNTVKKEFTVAKKQRKEFFGSQGLSVNLVEAKSQIPYNALQWWEAKNDELMVGLGVPRVFFLPESQRGVSETQLRAFLKNVRSHQFELAGQLERRIRDEEDLDVVFHFVDFESDEFRRIAVAISRLVETKIIGRKAARIILKYPPSYAPDKEDEVFTQQITPKLGAIRRLDPDVARLGGDALDG